MKKKIKSKQKTNVFFILDKSGSMDSISSATISGFNEYVSGLVKDKKTDYKFSLTFFDTDTVCVYDKVDINDVKPLTKKSYVPDGMTAMFDAICKTLSDVETKKSDKNLVVIMTDGEENSSKEYKLKDVNKKIKDLEKGSNWTFVFLGSNQDSWKSAATYGMSNIGNIANYTGPRGVRGAMSTLTCSTVNLSASSASNSANFFNGVKEFNNTNEKK